MNREAQIRTEATSAHAAFDLTVVIPTHRRHLVLRSALESAFRQRDVKTEVIVVNGIEDDADTDAVVAEFKDVQYIKSSQYLSCSSKRHLGLSIAKGRYVNFLDDDDYLIDDGFYRKAIDILDANDKLAFVSGNSKVRHEHSAGSAPTYKEKPLPFAGVVNGLEYFSKFQIEWPKPHSTCPTIFRKCALLGEHPLQEVNDSSIYLRALLEGDAYILEDFVAVYRIWSQSISRGGEGNDLRLKMETMIQKERFYCMAETKIPDVKKWWRGTFAMNLRYFVSSIKDDREIILLATWGILHAHGDEGVVSQCASALASVCPNLFAQIEPICHMPKAFFHLKLLLHKRFRDSSAVFEPYYGLVMSELDAASSANCNSLDVGLFYYIGFRNFGDLLSHRLAEKLSGQRISRTNFEQADFLAVGSLLQRLPTCNDSAASSKAPIHVWGTGFIKPLPKPVALPAGKVVVHAVRGANTLKELREMGMVRRDEKVALGDPGLLYADLIPGVRETKKAYDIAIIPHHDDQKEFARATDSLSARGFSVKFIDVGHSDPFQVVRDIASARKVLSSSLHGIIVADSLGIPNKRLVVDNFENDKVRSRNESHFKFEDYYSAFGLSRPDYVTLSELMASPEKVAASVEKCVPGDLVDACKRDLLAAFPSCEERSVRVTSTEPPKVSVVLPVCNSEYYIRESLDSVLRQQQLESVEVICVDDGSSDSSREILETYLKVDSRVRLIRQDHQGPGAACNAGLAAATGEYVYFFDADDRFASGDALLRAYEHARRDNLDVLLAASSSIDQEGQILQKDVFFHRELIPQETVFAPDALGASLFLFTSQCSCGKLYRRSFLEGNKLSFPALKRFECFPMVGLALTLASRIGVVGHAICEHRIGAGASLESTKDETPLIFFEAEQLLRVSLRERNLWERFKTAVYNAFVIRISDNLRAVRSYPSFRAIIEKYRQGQTQWVCWEEVALPERFAAHVQLVKAIEKDMDEDEHIALFVKLRSTEAQKALDAANNTVKRGEANAKKMKQIVSLESQLVRCQKEILELRKSHAYRIGMFVTWPLRKAKGAIKCLSENGINYTVRHFVGKVARAVGFRHAKW